MQLSMLCPRGGQRDEVGTLNVLGHPRWGGVGIGKFEQCQNNKKWTGYWMWEAWIRVFCHLKVPSIPRSSNFPVAIKWRNKRNQEPITRSVQLPYSVCQTAFSQASLFLDQPFPGISLRYFSITVRSFHFFWICLKVYLTITKAREKPPNLDSIERTRTLRNVSKACHK